MNSKRRRRLDVDADEPFFIKLRRKYSSGRASAWTGPGREVEGILMPRADQLSPMNDPMLHAELLVGADLIKGGDPRPLPYDKYTTTLDLDATRA